MESVGYQTHPQEFTYKLNMPVYKIKYKPAGEITAKIITIVAPDHSDAEKEAAKLAEGGGQVIYVDRCSANDD